MKEDFEYIENDESSWRARLPPPLPDFVPKTLIEIAGALPDGRPRLRCVWAGTAKSESSERDCLKYSCGYSPVEVSGYSYVKDGVTHFTKTVEGIDALIIVPVMYEEELGLLRWVIEKYVSPEELERAGRFKNRYAAGEIAPTLRSFPREGVYEPFLIVQTKDKKYREVTPDVLQFVRYMWAFEQLPFEERERIELEAKSADEKQKQKAHKELWRGMGDIKLPDEEIDRRNLLDEVLTHNAEKNAILDQRLTFYNPI